jgi:hypothetical protein
LRTAQLLALDWGSRFAFAGSSGRIDGASGLGDWNFGKRLLAQLLREHREDLGRHEPVERFVYPPLPDASHAQARLMQLVPRAH